MSYKVQNDKAKFEIVEKDTSLVVARPANKVEANTLCRSLNLGSGFNGFTPEFFTTIYPEVK